MKNITVSVDDDTYRRARIRAAELNTSISALVREFLAGLSTGETEAERLKRQENALRASIGRFRGGDRLPRAEIHERK